MEVSSNIRVFDFKALLFTCVKYIMQTDSTEIPKQEN